MRTADLLSLVFVEQLKEVGPIKVEEKTGGAIVGRSLLTGIQDVARRATVLAGLLIAPTPSDRACEHKLAQATGTLIICNGRVFRETRELHTPTDQTDIGLQPMRRVAAGEVGRDSDETSSRSKPGVAALRRPIAGAYTFGRKSRPAVERGQCRERLRDRTPE